MILAGIAGYIAFIFKTAQPTNIWYYMPLMAFLSVSFDAAFESSGMVHARAEWHGSSRRLRSSCYPSPGLGRVARADDKC